MNTKRILAALTMLSLATTATASAHVRHHPAVSTSAPSFAPARMIEVRPGLWVGSYQCITDLDRGGRDCSSGI